MKFTLIYTIPESNDQIQAENYKNDIGDRAEISNMAEAVQWGKEIIEYFNSTLRPHEKERKFYNVVRGHHARDININGISPEEL